MVGVLWSPVHLGVTLCTDDVCGNHDSRYFHVCACDGGFHINLIRRYHCAGICLLIESLDVLMLDMVVICW